MFIKLSDSIDRLQRHVLVFRPLEAELPPSRGQSRAGAAAAAAVPSHLRRIGESGALGRVDRPD